MRGELKKKRILLVEDHADNRDIYRTILEHYGYSVLVAGDGRAGLSTARNELPDLILMDLSIPYIDGWEATRLLKGDPRTAGIPVIALSAHALTEDRDRAFAVGCNAYLAKPVEPKQVLDVVSSLLENDLPVPESAPSR